MKSILIIGSELGKGGAERSLSFLSYYLSDYFDVTLCILSGKGRKRYYPTCADVRFVDPPAAKGTWSKMQAWQYRLKKIKALKRETGCIAAISFLEGPNYVNVLTKGKEKVILGIRGSNYFDEEIRGGTGWFRKKILMPLLYPRADKIVCASKQLSEELSTYFGIPRHLLGYVYNLYDSESVRKMAAASLSEEEQQIFREPVILHSGRLHHSKGQHNLIRLFAQSLAKQRARLVILGDGGLKPHLIEVAERSGLSVCDMSKHAKYTNADVYFLGYQANPFKFYAKSKLFVLCSGWEGFPNALAEALICGLPVLSSDCPTGPREILNVPVEGLAPTKKVHRQPVGSLMPLLDLSNSEAVKLWENELLFWMKAVKPGDSAFDTLTARFSREDVLRRWVGFINN